METLQFIKDSQLSPLRTVISYGRSSGFRRLACQSEPPRCGRRYVVNYVRTHELSLHPKRDLVAPRAVSERGHVHPGSTCAFIYPVLDSDVIYFPVCSIRRRNLYNFFLPPGDYNHPCLHAHLRLSGCPPPGTGHLSLYLSLVLDQIILENRR